MFSRKTFLLWVGILALSGMFLMGQDSWSPCKDADGDGYGDPASASCIHPEADCNDEKTTVYPGAPEVCNEIDDQCPGDAGYGEVDEGCGMAQIPAGCFDMGDAFNEGNSDERPVHNVCISAFEMDRQEMTNAEYAQCVSAGACTVPQETSSATRASYYGNTAYDNYPVVWVDWNQAKAYCTWAGKRLPTEAEWEYSARGGLAGKRYPWGDEISGSNANYWYSGDPWDNDTSPARHYAANGYGLYDMAGNAWEFVNDWYQANYYFASPQQDPPGPTNGTTVVMRGGSWRLNSAGLRASFRPFTYPTEAYAYAGFRCAR